MVLLYGVKWRYSAIALYKKLFISKIVVYNQASNCFLGDA